MLLTSTKLQKKVTKMYETGNHHLRYNLREESAFNSKNWSIRSEIVVDLKRLFTCNKRWPLLGPKIWASMFRAEGLDLAMDPPLVASQHVELYSSSFCVRFHPKLPMAFVKVRRHEFKVVLLDCKNFNLAGNSREIFSFEFDRGGLKRNWKQRAELQSYKARYGRLHIVAADWNPAGSALLVQTTKVDIGYLEKCGTYANQLSEHCTKYKKHLHIFKVSVTSNIPTLKFVKLKNPKNLKVDFCLSGTQLWLDDKTIIAPACAGTRSMLTISFNQDYSEAIERVLMLDCYNPGEGIETNWDHGYSYDHSKMHSLRYVGNYTAIPSACVKNKQRSLAAVTNCPHLHNHDRVVIFSGPFPTSMSSRLNIDLPGHVVALHAESNKLNILYSMDSSAGVSESSKFLVEQKIQPSRSWASHDRQELKALSKKKRSESNSNLDNAMFIAPERWTYTNLTNSIEQKLQRIRYANTCQLFSAKNLNKAKKLYGDVSENRVNLDDPPNNDNVNPPPEVEILPRPFDLMADSKAHLRVATVCTKTWTLQQKHV